MAAINGGQARPFDRDALDLALKSLAIRLDAGETDPVGVAAAKWTMTHDVSEGFKMLLGTLLRRMGHGAVADRL